MSASVLDRPLASAIRGRILRSVPAREYAFDTLLRLVEVDVTTKVPTAAIRSAISPSLLVNPEFVAEHCPTDEGLFMLVMHELHHVLFGHLVPGAGSSQMDNFVFDAVINAHLSRRFPGAEYTALFTGYYAPDGVPTFLLRPPPGWPHQPDWERAREGGASEALTDLHRRLYTGPGSTYDDVREALLAEEGLVEQVAGVLFGLRGDGPGLLGDHEGAPGGGVPFGEAPSGVLRSVLAKVTGPWPVAAEGSDPFPGAGGALTRSELPAVRRNRRAVILLRRAFLQAATGRGGRLGAWREHEHPLVTPLPDLRDRRSTVARSMGAEPILYESCIPRMRRAPGGRVHVYLDVSGSVAGFLPHLRAALRPFALDLHPMVHQFSCGIVDVPVRDLMRGVVVTDGGTNIQPVVSHILASRVRRALLITDGYVGAVPESDAALLRKRGVRIVTVLTPLNFRSSLVPITHRFFELPSLEEKP